MKHVTIHHNGQTYPARELPMPDGTMWLVSTEKVARNAPSEVDDMIGFYFPQKEFLTSGDMELRDMIGDCT